MLLHRASKRQGKSGMSKGILTGQETMRAIVLAAISFYQKFISPMLGSNCRFYPSCSSYTYQAIEKYGVAKGSWMGFKRILRCNPWNEGGFDPLP